MPSRDGYNVHIWPCSMNWKEHISVDPAVLVGKPVIKGTRLAVEFIVELLAEGWTYEQILKNSGIPAAA